MNAKTIKARPLLPEECEVRIDSISANSFTVVVYITSRAAMNILDETFGPSRWSRRITIDKKSDETNFFAVCSIEAKLEDGSSIVREDVGEDAKSAKAAASDAIKRAATNFIPSLRALYTLPTMRITAKKLGISLTSTDDNAKRAELRKAIQFKKFAVASIVFGNDPSGEFIKAIQIVDEETGDVVHEHISNRKSLGVQITPELLELKEAMIDAGVTEEQVMKDYSAAYGINTLSDLVLMPAVLQKVYDRLEKTKQAKGRKPTNAKKAPAKEGATVNDQLKGKKEA